MELFKHQKDFLAQKPNKTALVWSCGTGKTRAAIEWAKLNDTYTLIICPKALQANWRREVIHWGLKNWCIATKEEFRRDHKKTDITGLGHAEQIIVDEVHNGFLTPHFKSQMSKALRDYIKKHNVPRVLLLSATVYTSSPWNIYILATLLGQKWDWKLFNYKYFDQIRMGPRIIPVPKKGVEKEMAELTKKFASVVNIYDCMDVPLQNHLDPEYFALSERQKKAIKDNYDPQPIVRYTYQHEIENGILIGNEFKKSEAYEIDKNDRIKALCEENKKIAIVCRYNYQLEQLQFLLREFKPYVIQGATTDRDALCLAAEAAEKAVVLIQADCAEGYQLPSFGLCVFASMSYSYVKWEQICGRFLRMDKPSRTTFMYLLTEDDSIDQSVYDAVKRKEDFKINLFKK